MGIGVINFVVRSPRAKASEQGAEEKDIFKLTFRFVHRAISWWMPQQAADPTCASACCPVSWYIPAFGCRAFTQVFTLPSPSAQISRKSQSKLSALAPVHTLCRLLQWNIRSQSVATARLQAAEPLAGTSIRMSQWLAPPAVPAHRSELQCSFQATHHKA